MKHKTLLIFFAIFLTINVFSQTQKYDVVDSSTNTIVDVYWLAMDLLVDDVAPDDFFSIYAGVEWKQFINNKYRFDLGLHIGASPITTENEDYEDVIEVYVRPKINAKIHVPLIYKTKNKIIKVKTAAKKSSSYTTVWYKEITTIHRNYFNLHGGISSGAFDRKLKGGLNFTHIAFANINMGARNKKILNYFDLGVEMIYEFDQSGYVSRAYKLEGKEMEKLGINTYMSYTPNFAENMKIVMDLGYCHGITFNFGGVIGIPIIKK